MPPPPAPAPALASRRARRDRSRPRSVEVDVVVVGAGQAGLSTAYHLHRTGLVPVGSAGWERARGTYVVLDDNPRAGGAWQHRWRSLTMADAHRVHDLPGMPLTIVDGAEPAADAVPYYFAQYEEAFGLNVQRPVRVERVERAEGNEGDDPRFVVTTRHVEHPDEVVVWSARGVVNASGTWGKPFWPAYPGRATFQGRQLHTRDFRSAQELADGHVVVVGGGTSAVQLLLQVAQVTTTTWVTRRPPVWTDEELTPELGRDAVGRVEERVRAGLAPGSVVSVTGLPLTPAYRAGIDAGVLRARPMFTRIVPEGVEWEPGAGGLGGPWGDDGAGPGGWVDGPSSVAARTILWATGFRASLDHLAPLGLRGPGGGIAMDGTQVVAEPRVQLVGYGPSASTIGANRAGREAARRLRSALGW
ncbi:NAD(P)-binding domain-containing protein [Cellulomonas xiejunii]|uniref:NAD(P)-binding domain-containing protein n=1 Tax=Cellulomonas xiejunii TaxID=2968083 RepID=UPI001D0EFA54|nr:NAD(P)-binding domain-containing protein [Cellulomonas xiejunii]MCC2315489.1 NAD(P)-binding domain-containing protein [Cellulomonas xiejunii]